MEDERLPEMTAAVSLLRGFPALRDPTYSLPTCYFSPFVSCRKKGTTNTYGEKKNKDQNNIKCLAAIHRPLVPALLLPFSNR